MEHRLQTAVFLSVRVLYKPDTDDPGGSQAFPPAPRCADRARPSWDKVRAAGIFNACTIDCVIRIILLRLWEDFDESLAYDTVRHFLIAGKCKALTERQMQFILDLHREINTAENKVQRGGNRYEIYSDAGLITGCVTSDFYTLVNPEAHFDPFNIQLTGITPEMVADKPTFPELWEKIQPIMDSGLLIAHNAPFDMGVLAQCLNNYRIEWQPFTYYACTCVMGRACYPNLNNHKLNTLCEYLKFELDHHNAGSDSRACAELLLDYIRHGLTPERFLRRYDLAQRRTLRTPPKAAPSETTRQLLELKELLGAVTADNELKEKEVLFLQNWMVRNITLRGNFPFDKIFETVDKALEDGILEKFELDSMLQLFERITDPVASACSCDCFDISGKTFCLTGEFEFGSRSEVESALCQKGGTPVGSVTRKTDCLVVGSKGSEAWSNGNYGTKVKKAMELQEKGIFIRIVKEQNIYSLLSV